MSMTMPAPAQPILSPDVVLDTPSMLVDETLMEQNISEMQALANSFGAQLRPHIKTHKTPQIALRQISHGARGITCAKLGEAEVMVDGRGRRRADGLPGRDRDQDQPAAGADGAGADDRRAGQPRRGRGALGGDVAATIARSMSTSRSIPGRTGPGSSLATTRSSSRSISPGCRVST